MRQQDGLLATVRHATHQLRTVILPCRELIFTKAWLAFELTIRRLTATEGKRAGIYFHEVNIIPQSNPLIHV